jgi:hypothetical protein
VGSLTLDDLIWLTRTSVLAPGATGSLEADGPETLPCFADYALTPEQVLRMYQRAQALAPRLRSAPGCRDVALERLESILQAALAQGCGLRVYRT